MTQRDLTIEQAEKLKAQVGRHVSYYNKLVDRMEALEMDRGSALYLAAFRAREETRSLWMLARYASCKDGVGRDAKG